MLASTHDSESWRRRFDSYPPSRCGLGGSGEPPGLISHADGFDSHTRYQSMWCRGNTPACHAGTPGSIPGIGTPGVWCNGQHLCLPSRRCGFDSRHPLRRDRVESSRTRSPWKRGASLVRPIPHSLAHSISPSTRWSNGISPPSQGGDCGFKPRTGHGGITLPAPLGAGSTTAERRDVAKWHRTWFGTRGLWVRLPPSRPRPIGLLAKIPAFQAGEQGSIP